MRSRLLFLLAFSLLLVNQKLFAQAIICPSVNAQIGTGPSTAICSGNCAVLTASVLPINATTNYNVTSIGHAPQSTVGATSIVLSDDSQAGPYPIGFTFCFFGNSYTQFYIGSNGWISFTAGQTNAFTSAAIPSAAFNVPRDCIMGPWQDWHPGVGPGPYISYKTIGVAPCRALVVTWYDIPMFSCTTTYGRFQIICYETTNIIENHLTNKPNCLAWAGGTAVQGIHNLAGTIGITVPGRNSTAWTAVNEGWRYTPSGAPSYTINWVGPSGPVGTGSQVVVCPTATGVYTANATLGGCVGSTALNGTVQVVVQPSVALLPTSNSPICTGQALNLFANPASAVSTFTWTGPNSFSSNLQNPTIASASTLQAGSYTVKATSAIGCTSQAVVNVVISPQPTINPTSNSPVCQGQVLNLFANPTAPAPSSYTWTGPNAFSSNAQNNSIVNVTPAAAGNYTLKASSAGGCTTQVIVNVVISPTPNVTSTSASVCPGFGATLNAGGANSYTWNPGNIIGSSASFTPPSTQVYTVIGTSAAGCTNAATGTITINPLPVPLPNSNSPVCAGGNINLTVNAATSYTWTGPNAFSSNVQNPTITNASTLHAGSYTVKVTSALGCTAQAVVVVVVNPSPTITVGNTGPYCPGATIQLTVTASNTYTWAGPLAFNSSLQNPTIANSTTNMAGPYTVTVAAVGGCISTGTTNVVVNPAPTPTATSNSPVCLGKQLNLFANPAATSYTWSGPGGFSSNLQNPSIITTSVANAGNYTLTVTNAAGCTNSSVVNVVINPLPVIAVTGATTCVGSAFNLTANGGTAYAWTGPNTYNSAVQNPPFANAQSTLNGNYTVVVTSAQGCTNNAVANVSVIANPTAGIAGTNTMCSQNFNGSPNTTTLTASGAGTYVWTLPAGFSALPNLSSNPITLNPPVTSTSLVATMTVVGTAGSCTSQAVYQVTVYPNPTIAVTSASMCAGTQVTLTANNASTYTWSPATNLNTTNGPVVIANPANTTVYSVIGSSVGCNSQAVNATASVVPNPTVTINPNPALICLGSSINLAASGATNYTWMPSTALTTTNTANTTANPTVTTTYSILGSQNTCTNLATIQVSVIGLPTVSIAGTNTLCSLNINGSPNITTLTASGAATYSWTIAPGFAGNPSSTSNPITVTAPLTTTSLVATMTVLGTAGSCTSQAVYQLTVYPNPTITATSGSMCAGTQVTLTANNATTYTWSPATNLNTTSGPSVIANPANTTVYSVIGGSLGCNSQAVNATASVVPNPTVTINPNPALICLNSSINLTASGATNYTWTPATALTSTNTANTTANPTVTTTYSVLGSQNTCTHLATVQVSVIGLPTVSVVGNNTLCSQNFNGSPATTTLTASGAGTYVWTLPAGFSGAPTLNSNPLTITPPVTSTSLVATMTVLGTAGTCTNMATYNLTVMPNPTIATTSGSMCAGTQVTLTANNATTYTWSPSATLNTANGPSVIANPAVTTVYSVIGGSLGCNSQAVNATANVVPNPTVTVNPNPGVICLNDAVNLIASGATNYTWSPNTALTTTLGPNTTANPTVTTVYTIVGEAATCTHVTTMTVQVLPLPTISIVPSSPTLCMNNFNGSPNTVTLTAGGATSYTWTSIVGITTNTLNGSQVIGTSNGNPVITGSVIGANGTCSNVSTFTLNAIPNPVIATTSGSMCAGTSVSLTAANAQTYTWSPSATLNTANGPIVIASPTVTTMYSVIGSSAGCQGQTQNAIATVVQNPTVFITPFTPTICFGTSINLNGNGANNYTWTPNTAISATVGNVVTVNPTVTTTYQLIGEASTCTHVATIDVTVVPLPVINIALNSPTMCMNNYNGSVNQITVTASGATSYNWTGFTNITSNTTNGANIIVTAIPGQPLGTGTVVGSAQTCTSSATFSVLAAPNPVIAVPSQSVCQFHSVPVSASGADTYVWSPANTLNSSTGATVIASPTVTTVYSIIGSSMNCQSPTETTTVTVVANPQIVISPVNPTICAGSPIGLTAFGANNYTWTPATNINTVNGNFVIVNPTVTTYYSVLGEAATCTSTAVRMVSVIPLPDLQAVADRTVICAGDKLNINANGALTYTWSPNFSISNLHTNFVVVTPTVPITYTLVGTNGVCTKTITFAVDVKQRPVLNLTTDRPKICQGESASIFVSGCSSYSWHPSPFTSATNTTMATVTPTTSFNFSVTGYNGDTLGGGCPFTKEILIQVVPTITAMASWSQTICEGESVKLKAEGSNTYQWIPFEGLNNTKIAQPYASPTITTIYTVMVSDGGFCTKTATALVKVAPNPTVNAGADLTYNSDEVMLLNAKGSGTLTWTFGENILCAVCPQSQITATRSGVYHVEATNEFGCKAGDDVWVEVTNDYPIFIPNSFTPNYDGLNDRFLVYGEGIIQFEMMIFNRWQHQIFQSNDQQTGWDGTFKGEIVKNDSYTYVINYTTYDNKKHTKTGYVIVIRED